MEQDSTHNQSFGNHVNAGVGPDSIPSRESEGGPYFVCCFRVREYVPKENKGEMQKGHKEKYSFVSH